MKKKTVELLDTSDKNEENPKKSENLVRHRHKFAPYTKAERKEKVRGLQTTF